MPSVQRCRESTRGISLEFDQRKEGPNVLEMRLVAHFPRSVRISDGTSGGRLCGMNARSGRDQFFPVHCFHPSGAFVTPYTRTMLDATSASANAIGSPTAPVLDPACLDQLRALDPQGGAFFQRVLSTYLKSLNLQHDAVMAAVRSSDWQAVSHAAHSLKSASASVGALALSRLCAGLEDAVRQGHQSQVPAMAETFTAEAARVREAVGALQGSAAP